MEPWQLALLAFSFIGSVSWGYVVLRLSWPDVRVMDATSRMGLSGIVGFAGVIAAFAVSTIRFEYFFAAMTAVFSALFFVSRTATQAQYAGTIRVGIPLPAGAAQRMQAPAEGGRVKFVIPIAGAQLESAAEAIAAQKPAEAAVGRAAEAIIIPKPEKPQSINIPLRSEAAPVFKPSAEGRALIESEKRAIKDIEIEMELKDFYEMGGSKESLQEVQQPAAATAQRGRRRMWMYSQKPAVQSHVNEFGDMVSDIYTQLRVTKKGTSAKDIVTPSAGGAESAASPLTLEDIAGTKGEAQPEKPAETSVFSQLEGIASGAKSEKSVGKFFDLPAERGMGCPTCRTKNIRVAFCPYCGTGMCANCSPRVNATGDELKYACPKCGEEISVKK
jgi:DNA-directed RNA polymerase subunit RPC12/RpoP